MEERKYRSVSIPTELIEQVESFLKKNKSGYMSIAEFIKDAVRRRLEELEKR